MTKIIHRNLRGTLPYAVGAKGVRIVDRDGQELALASSPQRLLPAPRYFAFPAG